MFQVRSRRKWRLCILIGLLIIPLLLKLLASFLTLPTLAELTELDKCPTCFGVTMCPAFMSGHININGFNRIAKLTNLINAKNVFYGLYGGKKIVLKKLGHDWELQKLDDQVCGELDFGPGCQVNEAVWRIDDLRTAIARHLSPVAGHSELSTSLRLCPSTHNLDRLLSKVIHRNRAIDARILNANIWTMVLLNPEPLILQMLPEEEGWPVPKYYGACGRVVIEEYAGEMLSTYQDATWLFRAKLALQLLTAATHFTDKHPDFSFYLTDVSADNIAVDSRGRLRFVDLENIVIVDKNIPDKDKPILWNIPHSSEQVQCMGCFAFSVEDICSHRISDHNYYAVCHELLSANEHEEILHGGLLHDMPEALLKIHPRLPEFLQECAHPSQHAGRFQAARELALILANITASNP